MFWEIILSNVITTVLVGGGILGYHFYRKYQEHKYYAQLKQQLSEGLMLASQGILYYMALTGSANINNIKNIINSSPVLKKHCPLNFDNINMPQTESFGDIWGSFNYPPEKFPCNPMVYNIPGDPLMQHKIPCNPLMQHKIPCDVKSKPFSQYCTTQKFKCSKPETETELDVESEVDTETEYDNDKKKEYSTELSENIIKKVSI